ncbi:TPA: hypothetical protein DEO28_01785 [Candidatus Dependentiae bacterium]|nr:MAG: hypothetical protein UR14_C0004G0047 [candidate division TM6 bacterium GW2011_GWE2_31_21]KKP52965.1 MAG: hypothetical protein UR43_C0008G0047 [candidate division TM6 bacterium GW2011_GWF2_33_332]HBS47797.1 hypothetical protein [Candidatus Dependentiae bacterium]HBZ73227.1 hypothetical protein [Candidatus Dependentiae bacterium]
MNKLLKVGVFIASLITCKVIATPQEVAAIKEEFASIQCDRSMQTFENWVHLYAQITKKDANLTSEEQAHLSHITKSLKTSIVKEIKANEPELKKIAAAQNRPDLLVLLKHDKKAYAAFTKIVMTLVWAGMGITAGLIAAALWCNPEVVSEILHCMFGPVGIWVTIGTTAGLTYAIKEYWLEVELW